MAESSYGVRCDKKECILGESIIFNSTNATYYIGELIGRGNVDIYEDDILIASNVSLWTGYTYTPSTTGSHTIEIYENGYYSDYVTTTITVTSPPLPEFESLSLNGKTVKKIEFVR